MRSSKPKKNPSYCHHRASNQAYVTLPGPPKPQVVYLGTYDTAESRAEYDRVIGEWLSRGRSVALETTSKTDNRIIIGELLDRYLDHCESFYVKDGKPTKQLDLIKCAFRPLNRLYGSTIAEEFGPIALKTVRDEFIKEELCRNECNRRTRLIIQAFSWGVENELISASKVQAMREVETLKRGRCKAKDHPAVKPVADGVVDAILDHVSPQIRAMIEIERLTAMRPDEVVSMTTGCINMSGSVWEYCPAHHKTEHHDKERIVPIGPKAQAIIKPWLRPNLSEPLFQPCESMAEYRSKIRAKRHSKVWPSHAARLAAKRVAKPERCPADRYTVSSYRVAIHRACNKAGVPRFNPNQLRHLAATKIRRESDIDTAKAVLGHSNLATTEIYAEADMAKARAVMLKLG